MKRSNRLILLIGVLLAMVAFVGVVLVSSSPRGGQTGQQAEPTELPTIFAKAEVPLGVAITPDMIEKRNLAVTSREAGAFGDESQVLGKVVRQKLVAGQQITAAQFSDPGSAINIDVPAGMVAMSVQVDQVSGVGTVIRRGDYVDLLVGLTGDKFPVVTLDPENENSITVVSGLSNTSAKLLLEGMQVLGTLLPPPPAQQQQQQGEQGQPGEQPSTALTGQQEIVILAVTPQQAEVIKFAQLDGSITLVLRSPADFVNPDTNQPIIPPPAGTTGITLRTLVDEYKVLVPQLVEAVLPSQARP